MKLARNSLLVILGLALIIGAFVLLSNVGTKKKDSRVQVVATFYPMAEFARAVGGKNANVTTLVKPGLEPHDYEPTPQDLTRLYRSKLFVYNGAGLEKWVAKLQSQLDQSGVFSVDATYDVKLLNQNQTDANSASATDPHVWMDPELAIKEVDAIRLGFIAVDSQNAAVYDANAQAYTKQLEDLNQTFEVGLSHCQSHDIVTSHQAFSYLAQEYGLHATGIAGLSPDNEPSPQKLAQIADFARANNVQYIFFESLVSPKLSQTIASEVGAQTIVFNPLEGLTTAQEKAGQNYVSVQKDNLRALQTALQCQ